MGICGKNKLELILDNLICANEIKNTHANNKIKEVA